MILGPFAFDAAEKVETEKILSNFFGNLGNQIEESISDILIVTP